MGSSEDRRLEAYYDKIHCEAYFVTFLKIFGKISRPKLVQWAWLPGIVRIIRNLVSNRLWLFNRVLGRFGNFGWCGCISLHLFIYFYFALRKQHSGRFSKWCFYFVLLLDVTIIPLVWDRHQDLMIKLESTWKLDWGDTTFGAKSQQNRWCHQYHQPKKWW